MRLYLVQHGQARPKSEDPERNLSEEGIRDTERVAAFLRPLNLALAAVWQSGKARAHKTAEILASAVESAQGVVERKGIAPLDPVQPLIEELDTHTDDLMIVGHLPFMNKLASALAAGSDDADAVAFRNSGVVCLERDDRGKWRMLWTVLPEILA